MANEQLSLDLPEPKKKRGRKRRINYGKGQVGFGVKSGDMKIKEKGSGIGKSARRGKFVVSGRDALKYIPKEKIDRFNAINKNAPKQMEFKGRGFDKPKDFDKYTAAQKARYKAREKKIKEAAMKAANTVGKMRRSAATMAGTTVRNVAGSTLSRILSKANKKVPLTNLRKLMSISAPVLVTEIFAPRTLGPKKSKSIMENITKKDIENYLKGEGKIKKVDVKPKPKPKKKTEPKKEVKVIKPERKIDHSSDYSRARMNMRATGKTDGMAIAKRPSYFQNIDAKAKPKKKEKNNIVKTGSGGRVRTRSGFTRTGR
tara:strand:- start:547 stop:1491 length:945 start_codon:yes stop_codon:yes gene_type:complete